MLRSEKADRKHVRNAFEWERIAHIYMTTHFDSSDLLPSQSHSPKSKSKSKFASEKQQARHQPPNTQASNPPSLHFWTLFYTLLPRELRDQIYAYIHGYTHSTFVLEPPTHMIHYNPHLPVSTFALLPPSLLYLPPPILLELTSHFFATNTFYLRYRYTPHIHAFLTENFAGVACVPVQHMRRLSVLLAPPESTDDEYWSFGEESEFEWRKIFPAPRNAKCGMFREVLERDFEGLVQAVGGGDCEVDVWVEEMDGGDEAVGVLEWLEGWREEARGRGCQVRVLTF